MINCWDCSIILVGCELTIKKNDQFNKLVKKALSIADFGISDIYDKNKGAERKDVASAVPVCRTMTCTICSAR